MKIVLIVALILFVFTDSFMLWALCAAGKEADNGKAGETDESDPSN